jgi:hypothetical protein
MVQQLRITILGAERKICNASVFGMAKFLTIDWIFEAR